MSGLTPLTWTAVQEQDKYILRFAGELSRSTLLPLLKEAKQPDSFLSATAIEEKNLVLDLSDLTRIDSAGFALLCELLKDSRQTKVRTIQLINVPEQIITLADLFGLSEWIDSFLPHH